MVGLYLNPPRMPWCVCIDEKSQIQALDRTAPVLPIRPGVPETATHDYIRNGTTTLFAALEVATGKVIDACKPRHRHQEFLAFLRQVAKAYPRPRLHVVCDNYATHKHPDREGLAGPQPADHDALHPDLRLLAEPGRDLLRDHHPPSHPPRQLRPPSATSSTPSRRFIDGWNERCEPFIWTKNADNILDQGTPRTVKLLPTRDTSGTGRPRPRNWQPHEITE